jgi:hypothetical protein
MTARWPERVKTPHKLIDDKGSDATATHGEPFPGRPGFSLGYDQAMTGILCETVGNSHKKPPTSGRAASAPKNSGAAPLALRVDRAF